MLLLVALFLSCGNENTSSNSSQALGSVPTTTKTASINQDHLIIAGSRVGRVRKYSSQPDLEAIYGAEKIRPQSISIEEGQEQAGLLLFPNTKNELEVVFDIEAATSIAYVRLNKEGGDWITPEGIQVGSNLEALAAANGVPFQFYGFEWDFAGLVTNWNEGQLNDQLVVSLIPENPQALIPDLMGDVSLSSDDPRVKALGLKVGSIVTTFE